MGEGHLLPCGMLSLQMQIHGKQKEKHKMSAEV